MKTILTTFALLVLALVPSRVKGDNLFVEDGGDILRFDTTVGAASQSTFVSVNGGGDSLAVDASGNVFVGNINYPYGSIYKFAANGIGGQFAVPLFSFGLTLDTNGNLFMDGETYPSQAAVIYEFTPATNQTTFASGSGLSVGGLAFDRNGILWMANGGYGTVIKFATGGSHTTYATLPGSSSYPRCVAFDGQGDLFVSDYGAGKVYEFTNNAGSLSSSLNTFASVGEPYGLAFDSSGNLFVASESSGNIYEYINTGASLSPTATIFASGLSGPTALAIGVVAPSLGISYSAGNVVVSWPSPSTGFVLQTNGVISTVNWSNYSGTVTTNGTTNSVTISPPSGDDFFRLANP